ncbi:unnamed protein product, partial [marine sediment metagenome]
NWLIEPVEASKVISFLLNQLGDLNHEIKEVNKISNNIIETMTILEKRISNLEENTIGHSQSQQPEKVFEIKSLQEDKL